MPHIVIQLSGPRDTELGRQVVSAVNRLTQEILGKLPAVMATTVQYISDEDWFIGAQPLAERGGSAFHLDISIPRKRRQTQY